MNFVRAVAAPAVDCQQRMAAAAAAATSLFGWPLTFRANRNELEAVVVVGMGSCCRWSRMTTDVVVVAIVVA